MLLRHAPRAMTSGVIATASTVLRHAPQERRSEATATSTAAALDVHCLQRPGGLSDISSAAGRDVTVVSDMVMGPYQFWPQACRPQVVGLWLHPTSSAIVVSLRKLSSRSQWRHTLEAGSCLILGPTARLEWALALPPDLGKGGVRRFRVLGACTSTGHGTGMEAAIQPSDYALPTGLGE